MAHRRENLVSAQHTPGPVRLTDEELTALHESRDAAFHRKDWTEQARIQVLIDVEHIARWNEHVAAIAKATRSAP